MAKKIITREYVLTGRPELDKGSFCAVFLTDLHNQIRPEIFERLDQVRPDLVLVGGDMVVGKPGTDTTPASDFLKKLVGQYPVWYANGNHEERIARDRERYGTMGENYERDLQEIAGIRLRNQKVDMEIGGIPVTVYGLDLPGRFYKRGFRKPSGMEACLKEIFGSPDRDRYTILLAHSPRYTEEYLHWGADLTLCGHYHGGVVMLGKKRGLITPDFRLCSPYCGGLHQKGSASVIISAGLGDHTVPVRPHNPLEMTVLRVTIS